MIIAQCGIIGGKRAFLHAKERPGPMPEPPCGVLFHIFSVIIYGPMHGNSTTNTPVSGSYACIGRV